MAIRAEDWIEVAQTIPGPATEEVGAAAKRANAYVIFGLVEKSGDEIYNSAAVVGPRADVVARYRKTHLWSFEHNIFKPGEELCLVDMEFGMVGVTICYDACFPEFIRALATSGAIIIAHSTFCLSNEPFNQYDDKKEIYQSYCRTRAFENHVYFASANRVGNDNFLYGLGNSVIMTPWGGVAEKLYQTPGTLVVKTEWEKLAHWQEMEPLWADRRPEFYKKYWILAEQLLLWECLKSCPYKGSIGYFRIQANHWFYQCDFEIFTSLRYNILMLFDQKG